MERQLRFKRDAWHCIKKQAVKIAKELQVCGGLKEKNLGDYYDVLNACENRCLTRLAKKAKKLTTNPHAKAQRREEQKTFNYG